jgi:hypothetical protein
MVWIVGIGKPRLLKKGYQLKPEECGALLRAFFPLYAESLKKDEKDKKKKRSRG